MTWRLSWHPWGPLCCGLISALAAVYLMQLYIEQKLERSFEAEPEPDLQRIQVVVANRSLQAGQTLGLAVMSARQLVSAGVATDALHPADANWLIGQQLAHPVSAGQPIQRLHLTKETTPGFSALLAPGQRALTLNVSAQQSHSGLIRVGDRVDFFDLSSTVPRLLDNAITVIATGTEFRPVTTAVDLVSDSHQRLNPDYRTLTFAVSADKVASYELLQRNHQLAFWLRSPADGNMLHTVEPVREVDWIIGGRGPQQAAVVSEPPWL